MARVSRAQLVAEREAVRVRLRMLAATLREAAVKAAREAKRCERLGAFYMKGNYDGTAGAYRYVANELDEVLSEQGTEQPSTDDAVPEAERVTTD